jgi:LysM repeat protein
MSMNAGFEYVIQPEDTLWDLADDLSVSVEDIMAVNPDLDPNQLYAGQVINLPVNASQRPWYGPRRGPEFWRRPYYGRPYWRYPYRYGRPYPPYPYY